MSIRYKLAKIAFISIGLVLALLHARAVYAEPVAERQALEIAEFWYPAEINLYDKKGWKRRGQHDKSALLAEARVSRVSYLVGHDTIVDKVKRNQQVFAYIIEFSPTGYAIIAGDDNITPLLAFSIDNDFDWGDPESDEETNSRRMYLNQYVGDVPTYIHNKTVLRGDESAHGGWEWFRSMIKDQKNLAPEEKSYRPDESSVVSYSTDSMATATEGFSTMSDQRGTPNPSNEEILLTTAPWKQGGDERWEWYNNVVAAHVEWDDDNDDCSDFPDSTWTTNKVKVGCSNATLAILLRYHEWPIRFRGWHAHEDETPCVLGYGEIHEGYTYNWANMPIAHTTQYNQDIAWLMFHAGLINKANWGEYSTGASIHIDEINYHLGYRDGFEYSSYYVEDNQYYNKPEEDCVPFGWGAHDYFFCPTERTWGNAQYYCENVGMNLVRIGIDKIDNDNENEFIVNTMVSMTPSWPKAWIGAADDYYADSEEGDWRWRDDIQFWDGDEDGEPVDDLYSNWDSGQPDNSGDEDCGEILSSGVWNDEWCNAHRPYICEVHVDQSWLLYFTYASILRGLPVAASDHGQSGGNHAILIDGYRTIVPPGDDEKYIHFNNSSGPDEWVAALYNDGGWGAYTNGRFFIAPENYIYVHPDGSDRTEKWAGGPLYPYRTIDWGIAKMPAWSSDNPKGGRLWLHASNYSTANALYFIKPMEITTWNGDASINGKLTIRSSGYVKVGPYAGLVVHP